MRIYWAMGGCIIKISIGLKLKKDQQYTCWSFLLSELYNYLSYASLIKRLL